MARTGRSRALAVGGVLLVSLLVAGAWGLRGPTASETTTPAKTTTTTVASTAFDPSDTSVLWIVLDEAPLWPLLGSDGSINSRRWPGFAALAEVSTWYRDTISPAQWTYFAMPAMLASREPDYSLKPTLRGHPRNVFTALAGKKPVHARESITSLCPADVCGPGWRTPELDLPGWVRILSDTVEEAATDADSSLHFVHTLLPHRPWHLSAEMRLAPRAGKDTRRDTNIDRRRDLYQSHLRQYLATDSEIGRMVERMKASPEWDRTMVIVTADHGITFAPGESVRDTINTDNPGTLDDVFRVPLFIKYPGQASRVVSDCAVSTMDILPTVLAATGVEPGWDLEGENLAKECPDRKNRRVHWPGGRFDMSTRFDAVLDRVRYYDEWVRADGDADGVFRVGRSGSLVGKPVPVDAPREAGVKWTLADAAMYQTIGTGRFAPVLVRATGRIRTTRAFGPHEEALVAINGTFVGVIAEIAGTVPEPGPGYYFNTNLLTRVLESGAQEIELWVATWTSGGVRLARVGPPGK